MSKILIHTRFLLQYGCFALVLILSQNIHAQESEDTIVVLDTLIEPSSGEYSEDTIYYFDKLTQIPPVQLRMVPDSLVDKLKQDDNFWYANIAPLKKKVKTAPDQPPVDPPFFRQAWFKSLLWVMIIGAFVAVVAWYLSLSNIRLFRKTPQNLQQADALDDLHDIFAINYEQEIEKALNAKNYRLTTRLLYLQTLKLLSEHGIIRYKAERTNSDYLAQLYGTSYYKDFFRLTRDFDYTWYGKFELSEAAFNTIQNDFRTFKNRLPQ
jgi:hypothetical protein